MSKPFTTDGINILYYGEPLEFKDIIELLNEQYSMIDELKSEKKEISFELFEHKIQLRNIKREFNERGILVEEEFLELIR